MCGDDDDAGLDRTLPWLMTVDLRLTRHGLGSQIIGLVDRKMIDHFD